MGWKPMSMPSRHILFGRLTAKEGCQIQIVDWNERIVLDSLVRPSGQIMDTALDFRVHYQKIPITEEDIMKDGVPTLEEIQGMIVEKISADSILVTKQADQQLILLKLFHNNVIELSEIYLAKKLCGGRPVAARLRDAIREHLEDPNEFIASGSVIENKVPLASIRLLKKAVERRIKPSEPNQENSE